jgi:hypothetical protein
VLPPQPLKPEARLVAAHPWRGGCAAAPVAANLRRGRAAPAVAILLSCFHRSLASLRPSSPSVASTSSRPALPTSTPPPAAIPSPLPLAPQRIDLEQEAGAGGAIWREEESAMDSSCRFRRFGEVEELATRSETRG